MLREHRRSDRGSVYRQCGMALRAWVALLLCALAAAGDGEARFDVSPTIPRSGVEARATATVAPDPPCGPQPPHPSNASFDVAMMLMGSVAFIMALIYVLHYHDDDIRAYSWDTVSSSICMFLGVLMGMSWSQCFVFFVVGPPKIAGGVKTIVCGFVATIGWYVLLQVTLAVVSGVVGGKRQVPLNRTILDLKCFAVLLGTINAASNLSLWGLVQTEVPHNFGGVAGVVLACLLSTGLLFIAGGAVRTCIAKFDDDKEDEYEKLWQRFTEETEDGALCLTLAHLCVQATRMCITGVLPLPGGQVPPGLSPTQSHVWWLLLGGCIYATAIPIIDLTLRVGFLSRFKAVLRKTAGFSAAFCFLYAITWAMASRTKVSSPPGMMVLALIVTLVGFAAIYLLDFLADLSCTGETVDTEIKALVGPVSVFIGFGWKQAFVGAILTIDARETLMPAPVQTLACTVVLVLVVVPAWRLYILPVVMSETLKVEERRAKSKGAALPATYSILGGGLTPDSSPKGDLAKENADLLQRNAELEASIQGIRQELSELKQTAALVK